MVAALTAPLLPLDLSRAPAVHVRVSCTGARGSCHALMGFFIDSLSRVEDGGTLHTSHLAEERVVRHGHSTELDLPHHWDFQLVTGPSNPTGSEYAKTLVGIFMGSTALRETFSSFSVSLSFTDFYLVNLSQWGHDPILFFVQEAGQLDVSERSRERAGGVPAPIWVKGCILTEGEMSALCRLLSRGRTPPLKERPTAQWHHQSRPTCCPHSTQKLCRGVCDVFVMVRWEQTPRNKD